MDMFVGVKLEDAESGAHVNRRTATSWMIDTASYVRFEVPSGGNERK